MKKIQVFALALAMFSVSCGNKEKDFDATGIFEATEVTVSAEQSGQLVRFDMEEGDNIEEGRQVGIIDTVQLYLKARQIGALKEVYAAQKPDVRKQIAATRQQLKKAMREQARFEALVADGAANGKLLDDARNQVQVLKKQLEAQTSSLDVSTNSLAAQMSTADVERMQVADQLRKCHIVSPVSGTVLEKYVEQGEFAAPGKPLFKIADMNNVYLRAYVTSSQLHDVKLGQPATVYADYGGGRKKSMQERSSGLHRSRNLHLRRY